MTPEKAENAAQELHAKSLLPAHVGRFTLAKHSWDEPFKRLTTASMEKKLRLLTPMIGEPNNFDDQKQRFSQWWEHVE